MFGINRVLDAFWVGAIFGVLLILYFFITQVQEDGGSERWERWRAALIMWNDRRAAAVRASDEPVRKGGSTGLIDPVRGLLNQVEPVEPAEVEPGREPIILHNLPRASLIAVLAVQRKEDGGGYRFSANQIAAFIGGTKADILKEIAQYRDPPPAARPSPRTERPANGWH